MPLLSVSSGLKKLDFTTLILCSANILINSFKIAASPNLNAFIKRGM
jgi:hypothetical protein